MGLIPPATVNFTNNFASSSGLTFAGSVTHAIAGNALSYTVTAGGASGWNYVTSTGATTGIPVQGFSVGIGALTTTGAPTYDVSVGVGIGDGANDYVAAVWDSTTGYIRLDISVAGSQSTAVIETGSTLTTPFNLGFTVVGNTVCTWAQQNASSPWVFYNAYDLSHKYDRRTNGNIISNTWKPFLTYYGTASNTGSVTISFNSWQGGSVGALSMRDVCPVTTLAGFPVASGNLVYLTASATDAAGTPFIGVFTYDLVKRQLAQTGAIANERITASGAGPSASNSYSSMGVTNGSATVSTGATNLTTLVFAGDIVAIGAQSGATYIVQSVTSSTVVLTTTYTGTTNASTTLLVACYQNDSSAHIVQDANGSFHYFSTTWANNPEGSQYVNIVYNYTATNLLSGSHLIVNPTQLSLPNIPSNGGTTDPFMIQNQSTGTYYLGYAINPSTADTYYPALASSTNPQGFTWTSVGVDTSSALYCQPRATYLDNQYFFIFSNPLGQAQCYDLTLTLQQAYTSPSSISGRVSAPSLFPSGTNDYQITSHDYSNQTLYTSGVNTNCTPHGAGTYCAFATYQDAAQILRIGDVVQFGTQLGTFYTITSYGSYTSGTRTINFTPAFTGTSNGTNTATACYPVLGAFQQRIGPRYGLL